MWKPKLKVPLEVQFKAACAAASVHNYVKAYELLGPYGFRWPILLQILHPRGENRELRKYLLFTPGELLGYFRQRPKQCEKLLDDCGDKRYSPSSFVSQLERGGYEVGMFDIPHGEQMVQRWDTLAEAITDYVLVSLDMTRLECNNDEHVADKRAGH